MSRASLVALALAACVAGCGSTPDPCAGETAGLCIATRVEGPGVAGLDQLQVTVDNPARRTIATPTTPRAIALPVQLAVVVPAGTTGPITVSIAGQGGGQTRATGSASTTLSGGNARLTVVLQPTGGTDGGAPDLLSCTGITACASGDGCCPGGCTNATDKDCAVAVCGDKVVQPGERCDDGNTDNGDGCDPTCSFSNTTSLLSGKRGGVGSAASSDGSAARFYAPAGLASDGTSLFVADTNGVLWQVDPATGATSILAGAPGDHRTVDDTGALARFVGPTALAFLDQTMLMQKFLFVLETSPNPLTGPFGNLQWQVRAINLTDPGHGVTTYVAPAYFSARNGNPRALAAGLNGNSLQRVWVLDDFGIEQWRVLNGGGWGSDAPLAVVQQIQNFFCPLGGCGNPCTDIAYSPVDQAVYIACPNILLKTSGMGVVAAASSAGAGCVDNANPFGASFSPSRLAVDTGGAVWFYDEGCHTVRRLDHGGGIVTVAGDGTSGNLDSPTEAKKARFLPVGGMTTLGTNLFVTNAWLRRVTDGGVAPVASLPGTPGQPMLAATGADSNYTVIGQPTSDGKQLFAMTPYQRTLFTVAFDTGGSKLLANLPDVGGGRFPQVAALHKGKLFIAYGDGQVRQISLDGSNEQPFAGLSGVTPQTTALVSSGDELFYLNVSGVVGRLEGSGAFTPLAGQSGAGNLQDGTGSGAHFAFARGLAYAGGALYTLDGPNAANPGLSAVVRRIAVMPGGAALSGVVTTVVGQAGQWGHVDGVGSQARLAGATSLASDGKSLFLTDPGLGPLTGDANGPTVRQVQLDSLRVTTLIGRPGTWSASPGVGTRASVNTPAWVLFDAGTADLFLFDENSFFRLH